MKTLFEKIADEINGALNSIQSDLDTTKVTVEPPRDPSHGDLSTNAAMVLSKPLGKKPRDLAEELSSLLDQSDYIEKTEIAGPGFINLRLNPSIYFDDLKTCLNDGTAYGQLELGKGHRVCVEYVSVNPTGPMHVGHVRGAIVGDALCNLLEKAGYEVTREYYVNDAGAQIDTLARSTYLRYKEALGEDIGEIPEGLYPGDYLVEPGKELAEKYGDQWLNADEEDYIDIIRPYVTEKMLDLIKSDLELIGVKHDVFSSEQALSDAGNVEKGVAVLEELGHVYTGTLPPPKGKEMDDWEPAELLLFKSSEFGDDQDRALKKRDGTWAYTTPDIAYHWDKAQRGHDVLITVVATDHKGWVKRIKAAVTAVTEGKVTFEPMLYELVNFLKDGKPFKFSKRANNIITVPHLLEEVDASVVRFMMLTRKNDQVLDFDFAKVTEQSKDNPVFYVQYAHARCYSVLRHAQEMFSEEELANASLADADLSLLGEDEMEMVRMIVNWPRIVQQAATAFEAHRIAFYLQDLAATLHAWWNKGRDDAQLRFLLEDDKELTKARLAVVKATATTIASGLEVMGVKALEELRADDNADLDAA